MPAERDMKLPREPNYVFCLRRFSTGDAIIMATNLPRLLHVASQNLLPRAEVELWRYANGGMCSLTGTKLFVGLLNTLYDKDPGELEGWTAETVCNRTACRRSPAPCVHTQSGEHYCVACAMKINRANPEVPNLVTIPRSTSVPRKHSPAE